LLVRRALRRDDLLQPAGRQVRREGDRQQQRDTDLVGRGLLLQPLRERGAPHAVIECGLRSRGPVGPTATNPVAAIAANSRYT